MRRHRLDEITARLRDEHGDAASGEALRLSWEARIRGAGDKADQLLVAAIRLCRP